MTPVLNEVQLAEPDQRHRGRVGRTGTSEAFAPAPQGGVESRNVRSKSSPRAKVPPTDSSGWCGQRPSAASAASNRSSGSTFLPAEGRAHHLRHTAGQSMGGRIVLELPRRGIGGNTVALDPGGFWSERELAFFGYTLRPSIVLVRAFRGVLPALLDNRVSRTALFTQLSAHSWSLTQQTVLPDLLGLADATATDAEMDALTKGPKQQGAPPGTVPGRVTIGWGRRDLVTLPRQAHRAVAAFPDATLHWPRAFIVEVSEGWS